MNTFKVFYTSGEYYYTSANGTAAELSDHLKQDGGRIVFEDSTGKQFYRWIDRVEQITINKYKLVGTYRLINAIGLMQPFTREIQAETPIQAMDNDRAILYAAGYDHILYQAIYVEKRKQWKRIDMLKALGLE